MIVSFHIASKQVCLSVVFFSSVWHLLSQKRQKNETVGHSRSYTSSDHIQEMLNLVFKCLNWQPLLLPADDGSCQGARHPASFSSESCTCAVLIRKLDILTRLVWLWLRGRASIVIRGLLVLFSWSACQSVPGQDTEPQNCSWCAGWHLAWQPLPRT